MNRSIIVVIVFLAVLIISPSIIEADVRPEPITSVDQDKPGFKKLLDFFLTNFPTNISDLTLIDVLNCNGANALATRPNGTIFCDTDDGGGGEYPGDIFVNQTGDTMTGALLMQGAPIRFGHINLNITGVFAGSDLLRISSNESIELRADETTVYGALTANDELTVDGADIEFSQFTNCFAFETDGTGSLSCRVDEIDYTAGDGLALNEEAREFSIIDCASQEILKRNGDDTAWICAADNDSYPGDVFVNETGDIMTGNLTINANLTVRDNVTLINFTDCTRLSTDANGNMVCGIDTTLIPFNVTVPSGTIDGGNLTSIQFLKDGDTLNISEDSGASPLTAVINFTNISSIDQLVYRVRYSGGAGHEIIVGIFHCGNNNYEEEFGDITDMANFATSVLAVLDEGNHICGNNVSVRFRHIQNGIPSHDFFIDYVALIDGATTITNAQHDSLLERNNIENHPWALPINGSRAMTGNLNMSSNNITDIYQLQMTTPAGLPVISGVPDSTLVTNFNANYLQGKITGTSGNTIPLLDGSNTWSDVQEHANDVAILDDNFLYFGDGYDAGIQWNTNINAHYLEMSVETGILGGAGYVTLVETSHQGHANRIPPVVNNPTFRIYSSDSAQAGDFIEFYHDQTNPVINWTNGDLQLIGNVNVTDNATADYYFGDGSQLTGIADVYVDIAGDTMTGNLNMSTNLILDIGNIFTDFDSSGGLRLEGNLTMRDDGGYFIFRDGTGFENFSWIVISGISEIVRPLFHFDSGVDKLVFDMNTEVDANLTVFGRIAAIGDITTTGNINMIGGNINMINHNITDADYLCLNAACSAYMHHNGSALIIKS